MISLPQVSCGSHCIDLFLNVFEQMSYKAHMFLLSIQIVLLKQLIGKMMEEQKKKLTAICFLKSQEIRQKYECGICYEVCIKPVRCRGPCSKIFCMKCVSDSRQEHDICPYKCSSPFLVERIPDIKLQFFCPYNPEACKIGIQSVQEFSNHYKQCKFVSTEQVHVKQLQVDYKCLKGHLLQFFTGTYEEMTESTCYQCREMHLCRSFCRICDHFYCVNCRALPCSKKGCPIGHKLTFQKLANLNYICDICGISTSVSNDGVYDDTICNFGLCEGCYRELPQDFDKSKPLSLIANINTHCSCGGKLQYKNAIHEASYCTLCNKFKECPKVCPVEDCNKQYCLSCKIMNISIDDTCELQHPLKLEKLSELGFVQAEEYVIKEKEFGCMKCGKAEEQYYYDSICKTRLCQECLGYCQRMTMDKQRPIVKKCDKNHVLYYVTGKKDHYDTCYQCKEQKIIKFRCFYCESEDGISFCFQCRPIHLETCYYKHPLKLATFQHERECHFCIKKFNQFYYCKKCFFYVCKECYCDNMNHHSILNEQSGMKNRLTILKLIKE